MRSEGQPVPVAQLGLEVCEVEMGKVGETSIEAPVAPVVKATNPHREPYMAQEGEKFYCGH